MQMDLNEISGCIELFNSFYDLIIESRICISAECIAVTNNIFTTSTFNVTTNMHLLLCSHLSMYSQLFK